MVETTDRVLEFAKEAFVSRVDALIDDPYGFDDDPKAVIAEHRLLAADLGYDFDLLCEAYGSPYEIQRLREIEQKP